MTELVVAEHNRISRAGYDMIDRGGYDVIGNYVPFYGHFRLCLINVNKLPFIEFESHLWKLYKGQQINCLLVEYD